MSNSIVDSLMRQLQGGGIQELSRSVGVREDQVGSVVQGALPALMGALGRNARSPSGAESLFGALTSRHTGGILQDVTGALADGRSADPGILKHAFGGKQASIEHALSDRTGVDAASVGKILAMVAPLVLGALGKARQERDLDVSGMATMVQEERRAAERATPTGLEMLGGLLDADGDGDVMDDVGKLGSSILGSFLKRKR